MALGTNSECLLKFAIRYPGWHTMGKGRSDLAAMYALRDKGFLEVKMWDNGSRQFKLKTD